MEITYSITRWIFFCFVFVFYIIMQQYSRVRWLGNFCLVWISQIQLKVCVSLMNRFDETNISKLVNLWCDFWKGGLRSNVLYYFMKLQQYFECICTSSIIYCCIICYKFLLLYFVHFSCLKCRENEFYFVIFIFI